MRVSSSSTISLDGPDNPRARRLDGGVLRIRQHHWTPFSRQACRLSCRYARGLRWYRALVPSLPSHRQVHQAQRPPTMLFPWSRFRPVAGKADDPLGGAGVPERRLGAIYDSPTMQSETRVVLGTSAAQQV
jgi:hypothetical protein